MSFLDEGWKPTQASLPNAAPYLEILQNSLKGVGNSLGNIGKLVQDKDNAAYLNALMRQKTYSDMQNFLNTDEGRALAANASVDISKDVANRLQNQIDVDTSADALALKQAQALPEYAKYQTMLDMATKAGNTRAYNQAQQDYAAGKFGDMNGMLGRLVQEKDINTEKSKLANAARQYAGIEKDRLEQEYYRRNAALHAKQDQVMNMPDGPEKLLEIAKLNNERRELAKFVVTPTTSNSFHNPTEAQNSATISNAINTEGYKADLIDRVKTGKVKSGSDVAKYLSGLPAYARPSVEAMYRNSGYNDVYNLDTPEETEASLATAKYTQQQLNTPVQEVTSSGSNEPVVTETVPKVSAAEVLNARLQDGTAEVINPDQSEDGLSATVMNMFGPSMIKADKAQTKAADQIKATVQQPVVKQSKPTDAQPVTPHVGTPKDVPAVRAQVESAGLNEAKAYQPQLFEVVNDKPEYDMSSGNQVASVAYTLQDKNTGARYNYIYQVDSMGNRVGSKIVPAVSGASAFSNRVPRTPEEVNRMADAGLISNQNKISALRKVVPGIDYALNEKGRPVTQEEFTAKAAKACGVSTSDKNAKNYQKFISSVNQLVNAVPEFRGLSPEELAVVIIPNLGNNTLFRWEANTGLTFFGENGINLTNAKEAAAIIKTKEGKQALQEVKRLGKSNEDIITSKEAVLTDMNQEGTLNILSRMNNPNLIKLGIDSEVYYANQRKNHQGRATRNMNNFLGSLR